MLASYSEPTVYDPSKVSSSCSGRENWHMEIAIYHFLTTTKPKVEQLINASYKLRVFYKYIEDVATSKDMIIDPNYSEFYIWGHEKAKIFTKLQMFGLAN